MPHLSVRHRLAHTSWRAPGPAVPALALALAALSFATPAHATWPPTNQNLAVNVMLGAQNYRTAISDGAGGMFVAWSDGRFVVSDLYAQHIRADGTLAWNANGLLVCGATTRQEQPVLARDGIGGVYIVWKDYRSDANGDIFAQYLRSDGVANWAFGGAPVCKASSQQSDAVVIADGTGNAHKPSGIIVAWVDERDVPRIYAQHFKPDGTETWPSDGLAVSASLAAQFEPSIVNDGGEGAILAWSQQSPGGYDIQAQHIYTDGTGLWGAQGVRVCAAIGNQVRPQLVSDSLSGAWLAWHDARAAASAVYAQHLQPNGAPLLPLDGLAVCPSTGDQTWVSISADAAGGLFLAWQDSRTATDIYAQRLDAMGGRRWPEAGLAVCAGGGPHAFPSIAADGTGSVIVAWEDGRNGATDIYAQKLDEAGQAQWTLGGEVVSNAAGNQYLPIVVSSGDGTGIVLWADLRAGNVDLYAQRVPIGPGPNLAREDPNLLAAGPNPARELATFAFELPAPGRGELTVYDAAGRRVRTVARSDFAGGEHRVPWDARDDAGHRCPDGVYFARLVVDGQVKGTRRLALTR